MRRFLFILSLLTICLKQYAQVDIQSGAAVQNFPLINYTDGKSGISMGVGLAYSSGNGLLVNEIASDIGTGWSLDAGGIIVRIQNGEPDDQQAYYSGKQSAKYSETSNVNTVLKSYPNGYMYNTNVGQGCNQGLNYYPVYSKQTVYKERNLVAADVEQDRFVFRMNGHMGTFVIGKNGTVSTLGDSKIKISFTTTDMTAQGIRTRINLFTIITEDGLKYTFSDLGLTNICRYKFSTRNANGVWEPKNGDGDDGEYAVNRFWGFPLAADERPYVVNSWFLSTIENTNNGQKIYFNYQNVTSAIVIAKSISHQRNLNYRRTGGQKKKNKTGEDWYKYLSNPVNASNFTWDINQLNRLKPASTSLIYNHSVNNSKRLTSIILPNGGVVNFTYNSIARIDLPGENALSKVEYYLKGKKIRTYELVHGYFFKTSIRPYNYSFSSYEAKFARLCLLSVQKSGTGDDNAAEPPYTFEYYTGNAGKTGTSDDMVPAQNFLSQDHWGYYNGNNSGLSLTDDHDFLSDERTQYFKAVLPQYKTPKSGYAKNGLLWKVNYPTGGYLEYIYQQNVPPQNLLPGGYPQVTGGVSVSETILYDGNEVSKNIITDYDYKTASGVSSRWGDEKPSYYSFSVNKFDLKFSRLVNSKPGLLYPEMGTSSDFAKILGKALISAAIGYAVQVAITSAINAIWESAAGSIIPVVNIVLFVYSITKLLIEFLTPLWSHRFILSNNNNAMANPLPGSYSSVEVRANSPTGYNGKTVYQFTDLTDYAAISPTISWPYVQSQRLASWAYGLPKKVTVYDKNNQVVSEGGNNYNYITAQLANQNNFNCNCATVYHESQKSGKWEDYQYTSFTLGRYLWMTPLRYFPFTGRTDMVSSTEKSFTNGSLYYTTSTNVITDPMTLLQKGKIIQKDKNTLLISLSYFPTDFNITGGAIEKLKQNNAIHIPVSTETWQMKVNPLQSPTYTLELLDASVTEFSVYTFGTSPNTRQEVKPYRTYRLKSKTPVSLATIGMHNPNTLLRVPSLYKIKAEMVYDNDGNLVQTTSDDNVMSFINDYTSRYVTASVANASYSDIGYAGFESDGTGSWTYNSAFIKSTYSITGAKSFQIGYDPVIGSTSVITRSGLSSSKTYQITFWLRYTGSESVNINGSSGQLLYTSPDGWRLYQREITGTTSLTIAGSGLIDELRLFPKGALMSTVSYKEGIGKISECDANNRILYYEYDALARLKIIRDQSRNIIKTYEYNYKH